MCVAIHKMKTTRHKPHAFEALFLNNLHHVNQERQNPTI